MGLGFARDYHERSAAELLDLLAEPTSERQFIIYEALRKGVSVEALHERTHIKRGSSSRCASSWSSKRSCCPTRACSPPTNCSSRAKRDGFADAYLAKILGHLPSWIRERRRELGLVHGYPVPVSGVEDAAYYYSTYHRPDEVPVSDRRKVMVLGGGPNRIGQGIEFDYCCVHAAFALRDAGIETIMVNCNPETVSTDFDTADKLYFEPLTVEDVLAIYEKERPEGVIVQFGGQTPLNIARELEDAGVPIIGTLPETIDLAEDRDRFRRIMERLDIPMPESDMASTLEDAVAVARRIGYPLMVRPSYVLGGRGMEIVHDEEMLVRYVRAATGVTPDRPLLIDRFLENAIECEADAIADGTDAFVPAVMQHIEYAGVHSGDSACVIPPVSISPQNTWPPSRSTPARSPSSSVSSA
jgi:carbamoyl-phosphate synthase large subunit